jgi:hypothetical protein
LSPVLHAGSLANRCKFRSEPQKSTQLVFAPAMFRSLLVAAVLAVPALAADADLFSHWKSVHGKTYTTEEYVPLPRCRVFCLPCARVR